MDPFKQQQNQSPLERIAQTLDLPIPAEPEAVKEEPAGRRRPADPTERIAVAMERIAGALEALAGRTL